VLPASVAPRRKWSVPLVVKVLEASQALVTVALDVLCGLGVVAEARQVRRWIEVLGQTCERLWQHPVVGVEVAPEGSAREQCLGLLQAWGRFESSGSGPPDVVMAWQQRWSQPLLRMSVT